MGYCTYHRHSATAVAARALEAKPIPSYAHRPFLSPAFCLTLPLSPLTVPDSSGHCKQLAPEYEKLGEHFSMEKDGIMIAKVGCGLIPAGTARARPGQREWGWRDRTLSASCSADRVSKRGAAGSTRFDIYAPLSQRISRTCVPTHAQVDSEAHAATAGLFDVKGYPTLKWMPKGKSAPGDAETVNAPRSADGLGQWITDKTGVKARKPAEVCVYTFRLFTSPLELCVVYSIN